MQFYKKLFIVLIYIIDIFCCQNISNKNNINNESKEIQNAVYVIRNRKGDKNLEFSYSNIVFKNNVKKRLKKYILIEKEEQNPNNTNDNITYYYIKDNDSKNKIGINKDNKIKKLTFVMNEELALWNIIPSNNSDILTYYIQNKQNNKFWEYVDSLSGIVLSKTTDINNLTENNEFIFNKLYRESKKIETQLLRDEPIDVLIKYIDLSDPKLIRMGIPQTQKDKENGEIKYCVRSILQNIPWIRKIFILMPNEKVSYFKSPEEIKEKIVYVKDKDLLGFDTASSIAFQFNLHKMKKFGLSENFILMDDDYFIAKPLNKNNFFYEENGKIYPALITSDYYEMDKKVLQRNLIIYSSRKNVKNPHTSEGFLVRQARSLLLMYDIFGDDNERNGRKLIEPSFSHNAMPVKQSDIEEIHDLIVKYYPYANDTLAAKSKNVNCLQMHTLYMAYVRNQYDRKVSPISSAFYDLINYKSFSKNKKQLFVINTGSRIYPKKNYENEISFLDKTFPNKVKYEIEEKSFDKDNKNNESNKSEKSRLNIDDYIKIIKKYNRKKIDEIDVKINNTFLNINQKINELKTIVNKMKKNDNYSDGSINHMKILSEEINNLNSEFKKLKDINNKLIIIIIFFLICKIVYSFKYYNYNYEFK